MNPDTDPPPLQDGDAALEKHLRSLPCPALPPEWRAAILTNAAPPAWPWLTKPVKWSLAACWLATGVIHFTTPPAPEMAQAGAGLRPPPPPCEFSEPWLAEHAAETTEPDPKLP